MNWIKVDLKNPDTLPELDKIVLLCINGCRLSFGGREWPDDEGWLWALCDDVDKDGDGDLECDDDYNVTHWAELPEFPDD